MHDPVGPARVEAAVGAATSGSPDLAERLRSVFGVLVELERAPAFVTSAEMVARGAADSRPRPGVAPGTLPVPSTCAARSTPAPRPTPGSTPTPGDPGVAAPVMVWLDRGEV